MSVSLCLPLSADNMTVLDSAVTQIQLCDFSRMIWFTLRAILTKVSIAEGGKQEE